MLPYVAIGVVWQLVYGRLGFGAAASAFYLDPVGEPLRFLAALPQRLLLLLAAQLGPLPSDAVSLLSTSARGLWVLAAVAWVAFIAWFVGPLRRSPTAAFFASGLVLSLIPLAATLPSDRLLTFAGISTRPPGRADRPFFPATSKGARRLSEDPADGLAATPPTRRSGGRAARPWPAGSARDGRQHRPASASSAP